MKYIAILIYFLAATSIVFAQKTTPLAGKSWAPPNMDSIYKGQLYLPFSLTSLDNKLFSNETCMGKVTFISFWFEGCGGCRAEFPEMNALYDSLKNDPSCRFIAITFDDTVGLSDFLMQNHVRFPIATTDGNHERFKQLNYKMGCPSVVVLDKATRIAFIGLSSLTKKETNGKYDISVNKMLQKIRALE